MENPLPSLFIRLKEKIVSWRPVAAELSEDYGEMSADIRRWFRQSRHRSYVVIGVVLCILSLALGFGLKLAAHSKMTIGYEDYRLVPAARLYDLNALREQALKNGATLPVQERTTYPACDLASDAVPEDAE